MLKVVDVTHRLSMQHAVAGIGTFVKGSAKKWQKHLRLLVFVLS